MLHNEFEMQTIAKKEKEEALANNQKAQIATGFVDSANITTLYVMFLKEYLRTFLEQTAKYFLFPIAAAASIVFAYLAWREAHLTRKKNGNMRSDNIVRASVETAAAGIITTVVVGSLVAAGIGAAVVAAVFGVITPIVFTAVMAAKTLYKAGSALYYLGKSVAAKDPIKKQQYRETAKQDAIAAAAGVVATAAVVGVFLLGKFIMATVGIAVGLFGAGFAIYNGIKMYNASKKEPAPAEAQPLLDEEPKPEERPTLIESPNLIQRLRDSSAIEAKAETKVNPDSTIRVPANMSGDAFKQQTSYSPRFAFASGSAMDAYRAGSKPTQSVRSPGSLPF